MKIHQLLYLVFALFFLEGIGQTTDLLRVEYLYVPNSNTDNSVQRFRTLFQLPLKVSEGNYIVVGGEYQFKSNMIAHAYVGQNSAENAVGEDYDLFAAGGGLEYKF